MVYHEKTLYIYYLIQCHGKYTGQHNQSDIRAAHNVKVRCNTVENVPFDAKMWSDTCSQTSSDPRSEPFSERVSSRKTLSFEEQIMSKDKYSSIFSRQIEAVVFIILQIFFCNTLRLWDISQ